jgi:acyl-coenzyme A synthetase/AMP-(fatty) acid ligase
MRITRDLIAEGLTYDGYTRTEIIDKINSWKTLLLSRGAKRGDLIALAILEVNINHISAIFAIAELGMKLLLIDKPVSQETLHMTKMAAFGPTDFTLVCQNAMSMPEDLHYQMIDRYSKQVIREEEFVAWNDNSESEILCQEDDQFLCASTSGTTKNSRPVYFTHKEIVSISRRNISIFKFKPESCVLHTRNMHHASSLLTFLLPAMMISKTHHYAYMFWSPDYMLDVCQKHIIPLGIDTILCANMFDLVKMATSLRESRKLDKKLLINVSGFTVTQSLVDMAKEFEVEFMSHYGSIDTGIPLLVNYVTADTEFEKNCLGIQPDDFYKMEIINGLTHISCDMWDNPRTISDNLETRDNKWYYGGRKDKDPIEEFISSITEDYNLISVSGNRYLIIWDNTEKHHFANVDLADILYLDKEKFTVDTKVNMDQLREYINVRMGNTEPLFAFRT